MTDIPPVVPSLDVRPIRLLDLADAAAQASDVDPATVIEVLQGEATHKGSRDGR